MFGIQACRAYLDIAENLPPEAWKTLKRPTRDSRGVQRRARPTKVKRQVVQDRGYKDIRPVLESVAEFAHQPNACGRAYRVIALVKQL
ncbi:MAG: hypothetical protein O2946_10955 [Planctomycetota bacterium]|nr:hypothetical protein [Planctomycetota bacterium]